MTHARIVVVATPIWPGQPSSVCTMVLGRLDAELSGTGNRGRLPTYGTVAAVAVAGNEAAAADNAHLAHLPAARPHPAA